MKLLRTVAPLLTVALLTAACDSTPDTARVTGLSGVETTAQLQFSDWSTPVNLGPVVNSSANDQHPAISNDGLSLYFSSNRTGSAGALDLYVTQRATVNDPWGPPQNLAVLNSTANDLAPDITIDGHKLFFHSERPGCGGADLYVSTRQDIHDDFAWGPPVNLGCVINSTDNDAGPTYTEEQGGRTLYFTSTRAGGPGDFDIYKSEMEPDGTWGPAVLVPELSGPARDTRTAVSRNGHELFISSDVTGRPNGVGSQDLWYAWRASRKDPWSAPINLGPGVNSTAFDGAPALSFDGTTLYFFSARPGSAANDLYVTTRSHAP